MTTRPAPNGAAEASSKVRTERAARETAGAYEPREGQYRLPRYARSGLTVVARLRPDGGL